MRVAVLGPYGGKPVQPWDQKKEKRQGGGTTDVRASERKIPKRDLTTTKTRVGVNQSASGPRGELLQTERRQHRRTLDGVLSGEGGARIHKMGITAGTGSGRLARSRAPGTEIKPVAVLVAGCASTSCTDASLVANLTLTPIVGHGMQTRGGGSQFMVLGRVEAIGLGLGNFPFLFFHSE